MQGYIDKNQVEVVLEGTQNKVRLLYLSHHAVKDITNEEIKWPIVLILLLPVLVIHLRTMLLKPDQIFFLMSWPRY
ncbi:hypothetical protein TNCT_335381 [Trichonephila clavata]|uniref:Uncharacterized protein n=1 Tax=Trichonephila clavata TaxID=2740835 RepID=A0A8X6GCT1_TRICU|nr:hypothetical protein TNCT_335381 [Trichonephila clavata]